MPSGQKDKINHIILIILILCHPAKNIRSIISFLSFFLLRNRLLRIRLQTRWLPWACSANVTPGRGPVGRAGGGKGGAGDNQGTSAVQSRCAGCSGALGLGRLWGARPGACEHRARGRIAQGESRWCNRAWQIGGAHPRNGQYGCATAGVESGGQVIWLELLRRRRRLGLVGSVPGRVCAAGAATSRI